MATYAQLAPVSNEVVYTYTGTTPTIPNSVDITNAPQVGLGWTTPDNGVTWVAPAASNVLANQAALLQKAVNAIANNVTFLGIATPTTAQAVAQVQALTRQVNALIRLVADDLTDTSGT